MGQDKDREGGMMKKICYVLLIVVALCGCRGRSLDEGQRFYFIYTQQSGIRSTRVLLDSETGQEYLVYKHGFAGAITKMGVE